MSIQILPGNFQLFIWPTVDVTFENAILIMASVGMKPEAANGVKESESATQPQQPRPTIEFEASDGLKFRRIFIFLVYSGRSFSLLKMVWKGMQCHTCTTITAYIRWALRGSESPDSSDPRDQYYVHRWMDKCVGMWVMDHGSW